MFLSDSAYDNFMGRYAQPLAVRFADFAGVGAGQRVLDVGAGTGALTAELLRRGADGSAAEPSPQFVAALTARFPAHDVHEAGAEELPWPDESFDAALAQLVISFMRDAPAGIREMQRVTRAGGTVAVCMWDREGMDMLAAIDRTRTALGSQAEGVLPYRSRGEIASLFGDDAEMELLEVDADYRDFEDFWTALTGGAGPAGAWAASLEHDTRDAARARLRHEFGDPPGGFTLTGRAWAARATRA